MTPLLQCRTDDSGIRWIDGLIVPWDIEIMWGGRPEKIAPGGLVHDRGGPPVPLRYQHLNQEGAIPVPVGVLHRALDIEEGLWGEFRIMAHPLAVGAYETVQERMIRGLSPEYVNRSAGARHARQQTGQGTVTDGVLNGVALVHKPAYKEARVVNVRARTPHADKVRAVIKRYPIDKYRRNDGQAA